MDLFTDLSARVDSLDWSALIEGIDSSGCAQTTPILDESECREIASWYSEVDRFRSTVDMARYRFGQGEYRYFGDPVPEPIMAMRSAFYRHLLPVAREWAFKLGEGCTVAGFFRRMDRSVSRRRSESPYPDPSVLRTW